MYSQPPMIRRMWITVLVAAFSLGAGLPGCEERETSEDPPAAVLIPVTPETREEPEPEPEMTLTQPRWQRVSLPEFGRYGLSSVWTRGDEVVIGGTGEVLHFDGAAWSRTSGPFRASGEPRERALTHIVEDDEALLLVGSRATIARYDRGVLTVEHQNWQLNPRQTFSPWATRCGDELYVRTRARGYHRVGGRWTRIDWRDAPCADARPDAPHECLGFASRHRNTWTIRCRGTRRLFVYWTAHNEWVRCPPDWDFVASEWNDEAALYAWGGDYEQHTMQRWDGTAWTIEDFPVVDRVTYIHGDEDLLHAISRDALFRRGRGPAPAPSE